MKPFVLILSFLLAALTGCTQSSSLNKKAPKTLVGGQCEGCEAINESPVPFKELPAVDTLPDYNEQGPRLLVYGTVLKKDGQTPAPGVVLYVYHTDQKGIYPKRKEDTGWAIRHGNIRGWIKTNEKGQYAFYTLKPAAYPNSNIAAHIHTIVKEPDKNAYWIDEFVFEGDPYLSKEQRAQARKGGSGVLRLEQGESLLKGKRDIVLGKNIEGYE